MNPESWVNPPRPTLADFTEAKTLNRLTVDSLCEITLTLLVQLLLLSAQDAFNTLILALKPPGLYAPFQILLNTSPALKVEIMHLVGSAYARGLPKFRASHPEI